jgi:hypothetical protein
MASEPDEKTDMVYDEFFQLLLKCDYEKKDEYNYFPNYSRYSRLSQEIREYYQFNFREGDMDFIEKVFYFQQPTRKFIIDICKFIKRIEDINSEIRLNITIRQILETKLITIDELISIIHNGYDLPRSFLIEPIEVIDMLFEFNASQENIKKITSLIFEYLMFRPYIYMSPFGECGVTAHDATNININMVFYKVITDNYNPTKQEKIDYVNLHRQYYDRQDDYPDDKLDSEFYANILETVELKKKEDLQYFDSYCMKNHYLTYILRFIGNKHYIKLLEADELYPYNSRYGVLERIRLIVKRGIVESDPTQLLPFDEVVYNRENQNHHGVIFINHLLNRLSQIPSMPQTLRDYILNRRLDPANIADMDHINPGPAKKFAIYRHRTLHSYFSKLLFGNMIKFSPTYKIKFMIVYKMLFELYKRNIYPTFADLCSRYDDIKLFYTHSLSDFSPKFEFLLVLTHHIIPFFNLILEFSPTVVLISDWERIIYHNGISANIKRLFRCTERSARSVAKYMI